MEKKAISSYKALVAQYGTPITDEEFNDLREYANCHDIKLSGFKDFVGDIQTIKTVIEDIYEIAQDFPHILDERNGIWLELDYNLGTDFATTEGGHIIHLNAVYFADLPVLEKDYEEGVDQGRFVKGTTWRAIARHEAGHVVASIYQINPLDIAFQVVKTNSHIKVLDAFTDQLSIYSTEYNDGREIVSECFSAYYSRVANNIAKQYVEQCKEWVTRRGSGMKSWSEAMYWKTNKDWYASNYEKDRYELTKEAPPRAIESFRMWLRENNLPDNPIPINYGKDVMV